MMNPELKKKIVNTLGQYEQKIDEMQVEIDVLKDTIHQLVITPMSLRTELKDPVVQLSESLNNDMQPSLIGQKVNELSQLIMNLSLQEKDNQKATADLLRQSSDFFKRLTSNSHDLKAIEKFQKALVTEEHVRRSLIHFNEVISQCVTSIEKKIGASVQAISKESMPLVALDSKVNESLHQLISHLVIPQDLDIKKEEIKSSLETPIDIQNLCDIINTVTDLVIDAFNMEQNRFKNFLYKLTDQLHDFDNYLKSSFSNRKQASSDRSALEVGIEEDINQIKGHIDNSKNIEELSAKISKHFDSIGKRLKEYRTKEKKREQEYEKAVKLLQKQLTDSEKSADEVKQLLSFQKYRMNHDSLTGLPNRDSYEEHIGEAFLRWKRSKKKISLAIADLDFFKNINDNFGHLAGDKVLKKVALIFRSSVRAVDFISRIGGEEFVFIFEQTESDNAYMVIEKLRKLVEETQFYYREDKVHVSVSFGLTSIQDNDTIESLFVRADKALYKAKHAGRNRVEII